MVRLERKPAQEKPAAQDELAKLQSQLHTSGYQALRQLVCEIDRDRIVVRGTVPCFYLKQVAQTLALKTVGVERITSRIEVRPESVRPMNREAAN